jgi:hypothetical protein
MIIFDVAVTRFQNAYKLLVSLEPVDLNTGEFQRISSKHTVATLA